jgi:glycosyltransferase involved in cell wall biosynthesis/SAM-dependent methyltransferase
MAHQLGRAARKLRREARRVRAGVERRVAQRRGGPGWWRGTVWERVRGSGLFDGEWYRSAYPDVAASGVDPLWHFASVGAAQGRNPNFLFDTTWYRSAYPDAAARGDHPLVDYLDHGVAQGRDPGPCFDTSWYLAAYPDVAAAGVNPLSHYLVSGRDEGRRPRPRRVHGGVGARVVLVSGEPHTPGHQYRVVRLAEAIDQLGGTATVLSVAEAADESSRAIDDADVVLLWRTTWGPEIKQILHWTHHAGAKVVFDVDDLMVDPDMATLDTIDGIRTQGLTEDAVSEMYALVRRCAEAADACICTTPELAAPLRRIGKVTHVVPNGFDADTFMRSRLAVRVRQQGVDDGLCRIGYAAGSRTHQRDFGRLAEPLAEVLRAYPHARLVVFRGAFDLDEFAAFDGLRDQVEWRDIVPLPSLPTELARLDVNLAPLEVGNPFCEAKSDLKFFEAALVDVPTVASPTGPFRASITQSVNGFLADTPDEWRDALDKLVTDADLRRRIGRAAWDSVMYSHGPERRVQRVKAVLDQIIDGGAGAADAFALEVARQQRRPAHPPALAPARTVFERDRLRSSHVTVVVPVYNYADTVVEALESVRAQTLADLDLVVVEDASPDDSLAVVTDWVEANADRFNRVVVVSHIENAGLACARNRGFDVAETPYVLPLDADNVLLPECAARLLEVLDASGAAFAFPRIRQFGAATDLFESGMVMGHVEYSPGRLVPMNYIDAMALVRKSAWRVAGGYRVGLLGWEDYEIWCEFAELGLYGIRLHDDLALYRVHAGSMLHTVTHVGDRLERATAAITERHPWLEVDNTTPSEGRAVPSTTTEPDEPAEPTSMLPALTAPALPAAEPHDPAPAQQSPAHVRAPDHERESRADSMTPAPRAAADELAAVGAAGRLSDRARTLLPLLRCPETGEPLEEDPEGGLRSTVTGRRWPVVAGRPALFPGMPDPEIISSVHEGNALPERARHLIADATGPVLHLSGGGTVVGGDQVIDVDAAIFGPTDVVGDAHCLPFADETFALIVAMNAFEHYREPVLVARTLRRLLKPGGLVFLHTAFMQPVHEAPHHYYNCTRYGLEQWFADFDTVDLTVSDNFLPSYTLSWLASEAEGLIAHDVSPEAAGAFRETPIGAFSDFWRDPSTRTDSERWEAFSKLTPESRERIAAGFEYLGRRPAGDR